jgi:hypothetical protein
MRAAWAQIACARRCSVEKVEKIVITHNSTLEAITAAGKRCERHARFRNTSCPTMSSATRRRPIRSATAAASQCACSAFGITRYLYGEVFDQAGSDGHREHETDEDHEQWTLEQVVVKAPPFGVEEDDPVGLGDRPDDPADHGQRTEYMNGEGSPRPPLYAQLRVIARDAGHDL